MKQLEVEEVVFWPEKNLIGKVEHIDAMGCELINFPGYTKGHGPRGGKGETSYEWTDAIHIDELTMTQIEAHNRAVSAEFCGAQEDAAIFKKREKELIEKRQFLNDMEPILLKATNEVDHIEMDESGEFALVIYKNKYCREVRISKDSKMQILKDIINAICY